MPTTLSTEMPTTLSTEPSAGPAPSTAQGTQDRCRLVERFAPVAEVRERHEIVVDAPAELTLRMAEDFDLLAIPWVRRIFWLRAKAMRAEPPGAEQRIPLVTGTRGIGWVELARRPGREVVMGAAVQPWLPEPVFEPVPPADFLAYAEPDHVKIVWTLEAEPLGDGRSLLRTETRVVATDEAARRKFRRYWRFARAGIVLIRRLLLPAIRRQAERAVESPASRALDRALPAYDERLVCETEVDAPPALAYAAIREANLLDPVVRVLFRLRELPARWSTGRSGEPVPAPARELTVADFLLPGTGMSLVAEEAGRELVIGSVGRFWRRDYGHVVVDGDRFPTFAEPGYAKLAMGFEVRALPGGRSVLRYEARTATTDAEARRRFRRYWRLIRPGVWLVMRRALALIRNEAERRASAPG